jgi:hypothetical protein
MAGQIENLNVALPERFAAKHFMHWHSLSVNCRAVMQVLNRQLQP